MANHADTTTTKTPPATIVTSRRIAVATALLALSGAAAARAVEPVSPDAELIELGRQLDAGQSQIAALERDHPGATNEEFEAVMEPCSKIVDQIEHIRAHTLEGFLVKARAISWCNADAEIDPDRFCPHPGVATDERIAASIVRNLLGRA